MLFWSGDFWNVGLAPREEISTQSHGVGWFATSVVEPYNTHQQHVGCCPEVLKETHCII